MASLIDKINSTLIKLGANVQVVLAEASGSTSGETSGETIVVTSAAPGVVVSSIIPKTIAISYSAIGAPVVQTNEDGKEENVTDGEYILTTNKKITVQDGKLLKEEEVEEIEIEDEMKPSGETEMSLEQIELAIVELACKKKELKAKSMSGMTEQETKMEEQVEVQMASVRSVLSQVDFTKPGSYSISIEINSDGEVSYAYANINTYQNLMLAKEAEVEKAVEELTLAFEEKISAQEKLIEALKGTETKTVAPEASDVKLSKSDLLKLDIQEKINKNRI